MEELVKVPVPKRYVVKVYGFIASLAEQEQERDVTTTGTTEEKPEWLDDRFVKRAWDESPEAMRAILKYLAAHEDEWVPIADLAKQLGPDADTNRVAGTLGAFTRRCKNRYGHNTWPFTVGSGTNGSGTSYIMPAKYAAKYKEA